MIVASLGMAAAVTVAVCCYGRVEVAVVGSSNSLPGILLIVAVVVLLLVVLVVLPVAVI